MENILMGVLYLMCFAMAAICLTFAIRFLNDCKKRGRIKNLEFMILFCTIIICSIAFIVLPFLNMFGILN
ncbi:MAG: hypothetical protein E7314_03960 [Clostridiales bacterium]|nr:hypothetical protein [Clostridiales bacterium]